MQAQTPSPTRPSSFTWASVAALVINCGLAIYFLVGYLMARRFQPASPTTVLRAARFSGSWPLARLAWMAALLLSLGLLGWALARRSEPSRYRRAVVAALSLVALVSVVAALLVSPARPTSPRTFEPFTAIQDAGGYARAGLLSVVAALLYASASLASRRGSGSRPEALPQAHPRG